MGGDYESGYDPKYGYNRNAFTHKTIPQAVMHQTVKLIVTPIGLISEAIHTSKDKRRAAAAAASTISRGDPRSKEAGSPSEDQGEQETEAYVSVPAEQADELIASGQAVPADEQTPTHEAVPAVEEYIGRDEEDWALDEAASETEEKNDLDSPFEKEQKEPPESVYSVPSTVRSVGPSKKAPPAKMPFPVVLPQRRPGSKARGFVRAYAPVLQDAGIDEDMFLRFLKDFHKAAQASPIFDVVMVVTAIMGVYPDIIVGAVVQAVQIAAMVGQETQERWRTNKFLDQANKDIFKPRGLYALIVTYKPGTGDQPEVGTKTVDLGATAMAKYGGASKESDTPALDEKDGEAREKEKKKMDEVREKMKRLRVSSGETHGEAEIPVTCAPLIFPALDAAAADATAKEDSDEGVVSSIKTRSKDSGRFVNEYFDRRAQAVYAANNPESTLAAQMAPVAPQFKSRFADPNNVTNRHLFSLVTGGHYKAEPLGGRRRYERAQRKAAEKRAQGLKAKSTTRLLQENVLYLMVVNMPTEQELAKARKDIAAAKAAKKTKTTTTTAEPKASG